MRRVAAILLALGVSLHAAGGDPAAYARVVSGQILRFPVDEGSHPEFRTEWWYLTGWLKLENRDEADTDSRQLGFQITFFRSRPDDRAANENPSAFAPRQLLFAHAAISDPKLGRLRHDERAARAGFGLAEANEGRAEIWIDDWSLRADEQGYRAEIPGNGFRLSLRFEKTQPPLIQGDAGFSRKGPGAAQASYYYSMPQLKVTGTIARDGKTETVSGTAWLDHEWSSTYLAEGAVGWDWTAINLDDGGAFMAFRMRDAAGASVWAGGSLRRRDGRMRIFKRDEIRFEPIRIWRSPRTSTAYPVTMRVQAGDLDYGLDPLFDDQEFDTRATTGAIYWEGAVQAKENGRQVGRGYLELTGYWRRLRL